jgi:hypothetical protein
MHNTKQGCAYTLKPITAIPKVPTICVSYLITLTKHKINPINDRTPAAKVPTFLPLI